MTNFGIHEHYQSRLTPDFYHAYDTERNWQHAVYAFALNKAKHGGYHTIIDVGCGDGRKLQPFQTAFKVIGLDYGANLAYCRQHYPDAIWLECQLEDTHAYPQLDTGLLENALIICADVIEHLVSPDILLTHLHEWLGEAACAIVSTPERDRVHGHGHMGPPPNPCHVREWNTDEFVGYLATQQLQATAIQHVPAYEGCTQADNLMVTLKRDTR